MSREQTDHLFIVMLLGWILFYLADGWMSFFWAGFAVVNLLLFFFSWVKE